MEDYCREISMAILDLDVVSHISIVFAICLNCYFSESVGLEDGVCQGSVDGRILFTIILYFV